MEPFVITASVLWTMIAAVASAVAERLRSDKEQLQQFQKIAAKIIQRMRLTDDEITWLHMEARGLELMLNDLIVQKKWDKKELLKAIREM